MRCRANAIIAVMSLLPNAALPAVAEASPSPTPSPTPTPSPSPAPAPRGGTAPPTTTGPSATTTTGSSTSSGGAGVGTQTGGATVQTPVAAPSSPNTTVSGNGLTITAQASAPYNHTLVVTGTVDAAGPGSGVAVQRYDKTSGWTTVAQATVGGDDTFTATWKTNHTGVVAMRAISLPIGATSSPTAATASARTQGPSNISGSTSGGASWSLATGTPTPSGSPALDVTVYRQSIATLYGPGFFGQRTACGQTLRTATIGVASRTLKCGTQVAVYYKGKMLVVPVIDRGPYANNADWDLTQLTAKALGIAGTAAVGAVALTSH